MDQSTDKIERSDATTESGAGGNNTYEGKMCKSICNEAHL